ncbi:MAG: TlpA disulfide reductase family protein [Thermodesulfobacteriota bacterium]
MLRGKGLFSGSLQIAGLAFLAIMLLAANSQAAKKMPGFSEKNIIDGAVVSSEDFKGKVVLVNFWATWCPPCRKEIPYLMKLQEKYGQKDFTVLGISMDEGGRRFVKKFVNKLGVNYPVIIGGSKLARGFGGVIGIPVTFLVDRDGNLVKRLDGYVSERVLEKELAKVL